MQVSEQKDHITHAVIGGHKTIDFGISNSAEFFNILSSTLYKDQILAVTREVLCNAWDAHIEAGCTDKPVEITLEDDKLTIKDWGKGVHREDMGLIYGTYGNSTKKNDGNQTGGFGLGCKAPFAYTDHFEVVSSNDGIRTIYNLSKSSAQAQGKPGIVPIASFPTKDTGLTVSIPILNSADHRRFRLLIRRIVRNGDMNMTLNGDPIETLGFDNTKASVLITLDGDLIENQTKIMVRYGNVIYPVDSTTELAESYTRIVSHLEKLTYNRNGYADKEYHIVFQAPAHSIAVTPSRESLSMQGHTTKTLRTMFEDFITMLRADFPVVCDKIAVDVVLEAVKAKMIPALLNPEARLPLKTEMRVFVPSSITDLETMARRYMQQNYPQSLDFRKKDITFRLTEMVKANQLDRGLVQTYLRALEKVQTAYGSYNREANHWLQKEVIGRIAGRLIKQGLDVDRLYVYDPEDQYAPKREHGRTEVPPIVSARNACPKHLFNALPYLRNIVVLATSARGLMDRCKRHEVFEKLGAHTGFIFYHVGPKKTDKEKALVLFNYTNMQVVDLTFRQDWEISARSVSDIPAPRKKPKVGLPCLTGLKYNSHIETTNMLLDDGPRIENPEFVVEVSLRSEVSKSSFGCTWDDKTSRYIVDLFGDKGGITNNSAIMNKWLNEKGAKKMLPYVIEKVSQYMVTSPTIQEYWQYNLNRVKSAERLDHTSLLDTIYATEQLRIEYGLVNNLTVDDKKYIAIWERLLEKQSRYEEVPSEITATIKHLKTIPLHQANFDLVNRFKGNKLLSIINDSGLANIIKKAGSDPVAADAIALLNIVLNK